MNILIYGAGPLGSIFAARLQEGGHNVSLLARGRRLAELREHGIVLVDARTGTSTVTHVPLVERLEPDDPYDLALVILRKNRLAEVLPSLAANPHIPNVLFLMNNAAGPGEMVEALGGERVLIGFPVSAGYMDGHAVRCLVGTPDEKATIPVGEVDGRITPRLQAVADALGQMPGYEVELRKDMDAWLRTHVALLFPSIAPAFYAAGSDRQRLVETRDLLVLAVRAVREGFHVLRELGIPVTPRRLRQFDWLPEPVLVAFLQRLLARDEMEVALAGHARAAHDEVQHLAGEFRTLRDRSGLETPAIDALYPYISGEAPDAGAAAKPAKAAPAVSPPPEIPAGSASIPMDWSGVWVSVTALATVLGGVFLVGGLLVHRRRKKGENPD